MRHRFPPIATGLPMAGDSHGSVAAPTYRHASEKYGNPQSQREAGINPARGCWVTARRSDNNATQSVTIDAARAREGARITARIVRAARLRDMLAREPAP